MPKQPYLTGFPTTLFGSRKRSAQAQISRRRKDLDSLGHLQEVFSNILPERLFDKYLSCPGEVRDRLYNRETTFWAFLSQTLSGDPSLAQAVARVQAWAHDAGKEKPSAATGAYSQARKKLPFVLLDELHEETCRRLRQATTDDDLWFGRTIKMVDGTSLQAADTRENQAIWPQPSEQKEGCGFPVVYMLALLNWTTGGWEQWATYGCGHHESKVMQRLLGHIAENDVLIADRAYSSYSFMAQLRSRGADLITRLHHAKKINWSEGKKLSGSNDRLFTFAKPSKKLRLSPIGKDEWDALPEQLEVRIIRVKGKGRHGAPKPMCIVTTLTDHWAYPAEEIAILYRRRWDIELRLRDIKTTLGMEKLRCKKPEMVIKELTMYAIGFNLLRYLKTQASKQRSICPTRISFKGVLTVIRALPEGQQWKGCKNTRKLFDWVIERVGERVVPLRPDRHEPRARKRRPKPYQLLTSHRHKFKEIPHRNRYRKTTTEPLN